MTQSRAGDVLMKVAYGTLFVGVLPLLLVLWAWRLDRWVRLPVPDTVIAGAVCVAAGLAPRIARAG